MTTKQLLDDGSYACMGADITVDAVPIAFVCANPELIVVAFQRWDTCPDEWEVDNVQSLIELNEYIRANYAVDQKRVYAIGSSMGTIPVASAAVVPGATDVLFGPKDGLMSGADKDKLDAIEAGANRYVLPEAGTVEAGGVRVTDVETFPTDPPVAADATEQEITEAIDITIAGMVGDGRLIEIVRCAQNGVIYAKPATALTEYYQETNFVEMTDAEVDLIVDTGAVGRDTLDSFQLG